MKRMFQGKAKYCGIGSFYLIVFKDTKPEYKERSTSSGNREVNINIFDLKQEFRTLTGGGHKIHATDSQKETNKDLCLLLGKNIQDYLASHGSSWDNTVVNIHRNVPGVGGYDSLKSFLYVLNSSVEYVVLRNYEDYPEKYSSREHGDIDLLVSNLKLIKYLTGARKVFNRKNRVHHKIRIQGNDVFFDFRYVGDSYYDKNWEQQILESRILKDGLFYIPDETNHYYSLLYHAILHKPFLTQSYQAKLANGSKKSDDQLFQELDKFMRKYLYKYVIPKDLSVYFNSNNVLEPEEVRMNMVRRLRQMIVTFRLNMARLIRKK